jgi:hypothetical protein
MVELQEAMVLWIMVRGGSRWRGSEVEEHHKSGVLSKDKTDPPMENFLSPRGVNQMELVQAKLEALFVQRPAWIRMGVCCSPYPGAMQAGRILLGRPKDAVSGPPQPQMAAALGLLWPEQYLGFDPKRGGMSDLPKERDPLESTSHFLARSLTASLLFSALRAFVAFESRRIIKPVAIYPSRTNVLKQPSLLSQIVCP